MRRVAALSVLSQLVVSSACVDDGARAWVVGAPVDPPRFGALDVDPIDPVIDPWGLPELPRRAEDFEALFALDTLKTLRVDFTLDEWNALLGDYDRYARNELSRRARLSIAIGDDAPEVFEDVGVRVRGNVFSRERPEAGEGLHDPAALLQRTHLKIELDETFDGDESVYGSADLPVIPANDGRSFRGVRSMSLKVNRDDPSYLREVVAYELFRRAGVEAPRAALARLFVRIGDEPERYLGVYALIEDVDSTWLRRRFGDVAPLWKCLWQQLGPADLTRTDTDGDLGRGLSGVERTDPATPAEGATWSDARSYRPSYDLKTQRSRGVEAAARLNALITTLSRARTSAELRAVIDVEALLRALAVNAFVGMSDDYWRNGNNYYLAERPDDGRWLFIPFDYDRTFGVRTTGPREDTSSFRSWGSGGNVPGAPLATRVLANDDLERSYLRYVEALAAGDDAPFAWARLEPLFTALQALVAPHVTGYDGDDPEPFDADLSEIRAFVEARRRVAEAERPE